MSRLGKSLITDSELLSLDRLLAEIEAVEATAVASLTELLLNPSKLSVAAIGPSEALPGGGGADLPRPRRHRGRVKILLFGAGGKVGTVLGLALGEAGHDVVSVGSGHAVDTHGHDIAIDFTRPDAVRGNVERCLAAGIPCVVGTTGLGPRGPRALDALARERGVACFVAPNFAIGAVLMMRFAAEAASYLPRAEIVELHPDTKLDAPSGTAKATAAALRGDVPIHSVRLPGLVAHQEVLFGGEASSSRSATTPTHGQRSSTGCCSRSSGSDACRPASRSG